jgi:hypothetical protein
LAHEPGIPQQSPALTHSLPELWHLLSLDAPTVAILWFLLAARTAHLHLCVADSAALFLGTWMMYVIDRLLDAHGGEPCPEERHRFHGAHGRAFVIALLCATPVQVCLLTKADAALLHSWLVLAAGIAGYYTLIHSRKFKTPLPKELAVAVAFSAAIFMPELLAPSPLLPHAIYFCALCWVNSTAIYEREHDTLQAAHWSTRLVLHYTPALQVLVLAASIALCFLHRAPRALALSMALSAVILIALRSSRHRMGRLRYRVAADAALLTPLLFLFR